MNDVVFAHVFGSVGDQGRGGDRWVREEDWRGLGSSRRLGLC